MENRQHVRAESTSRSIANISGSGPSANPVQKTLSPPGMDKVEQGKMQDMIDNSEQVKKLVPLQRMANGNSRPHSLPAVGTTVQRVTADEVPALELELLTYITNYLKENAPAASNSLIDEHALSIRNNVMSYLGTQVSYATDAAPVAFAKGRAHFLAAFAPIFLRALNPAELIPLLDHFSATWHLPKSSPVFRSRVLRMQITDVEPYATGNCHGYSLYGEDTMVDFSLEGWRRQSQHIIVFTQGTRIDHSARLIGGGRIRQTFSNGMPLFSCNYHAFFNYSGYTNAIDLPTNLAALKALTGITERSPEEELCMRLFNEVYQKVMYWNCDDDLFDGGKTKDDIFSEVEAMHGKYTPVNKVRLEQIKAVIATLKS